MSNNLNNSKYQQSQNISAKSTLKKGFSKKGSQTSIKIIAKNPTAFHNYEIISEYEAGIVLYGTEIKSIRQGKINLKDSYASINNNECFAYGINISPYEHGNIYNKDPLRPRKLLLNKKEILKLSSCIKLNGYTLVPINIYFKGSFVKMSLGVGKGKKLYDKREDLKKKEAQKQMKISQKYKNL